jgi:hypothetical protein
MMVPVSIEMNDWVQMKSNSRMRWDEGQMQGKCHEMVPSAGHRPELAAICRLTVLLNPPWKGWSLRSARMIEAAPNATKWKVHRESRMTVKKSGLRV